MDIWDGKGYFLLTESIVLHQNFQIYYDSPSVEETNFMIRNYFNWQYGLQNEKQVLPPGDPSPMYTSASPLLSYLAVPLYLVAQIINFSPITLTSFFLNSIILAFSATLVYAFATELYQSRKIAFVLALVAGVCSFAWPYIDTLFQQPLAGLMIISAAYFLYLASKGKHESSPILAGFFTGLIVMAHTGTIILVPGIVAMAMYLFRKDAKKILYYFLGLIPIAALLAYFNLFRFGSILDFGYGHIQGLEKHTSIEGIYGMIFSPGFGLIVNFPLFVLFPIALYYLWKKNKPLTVLFGYIFVSTWLFFGIEQSPLWHGLGAWGGQDTWFQ